MAELQTIPSVDVAIKPQMNSWSSPPLGYLLQIKEIGESPNSSSAYFLEIDDNGNSLLIA
jgi:hypothetical protein